MGDFNIKTVIVKLLNKRKLYDFSRPSSSNQILKQCTVYLNVPAVMTRCFLSLSLTLFSTVTPSSLIGHMLQRDPKKRATLEEIGAHEWLQGVDPSPATKLSTPLVSHRSLSEEEHGSIIQRMVLGGIADRDTITEYVSLYLPSIIHAAILSHVISQNLSQFCSPTEA